MKPLEMYLGNKGPLIIADEGVCHLHSQAGLEEIVILGFYPEIDITGARFRVAIQIQIGVLE